MLAQRVGLEEGGSRVLVLPFVEVLHAFLETGSRRLRRRIIGALGERGASSLRRPEPWRGASAAATVRAFIRRRAGSGSERIVPNDTPTAAPRGTSWRRRGSRCQGTRGPGRRGVRRRPAVLGLAATGGGGEGVSSIGGGAACVGAGGGGVGETSVTAGGGGMRASVAAAAVDGAVVVEVGEEDSPERSALRGIPRAQRRR